MHTNKPRLCKKSGKNNSTSEHRGDDKAPARQKYVPFFSDKGVRLYLGDAMEVLATIPEESVDLVVADPPYGLSNDGFTCYAGKRASVNKGAWDKSRGVEKDFEFHNEWIVACRRVLKPHGSLWVSGTYHSIYACGHALQQNGWHILNEISWYKPNAAPHLACRMFAASHETLIWARKNKAAKHLFHYDIMRNSPWPGDFIKKDNRQMRSVWAINTPLPGEKKYGKHPAQKPLALLSRIITACTNPGDLVLDPFCGSGTTGVAALSKKCKFVGIDNKVEYLKTMAVPRIKDALTTRT